MHTKLKDRSPEATIRLVRKVSYLSGSFCLEVIFTVAEILDQTLAERVDVMYNSIIFYLQEFTVEN